MDSGLFGVVFEKCAPRRKIIWVGERSGEGARRSRQGHLSILSGYPEQDVFGIYICRVDIKASYLKKLEIWLMQLTQWCLNIKLRNLCIEERAAF